MKTEFKKGDKVRCNEYGSETMTVMYQNENTVYVYGTQDTFHFTKLRAA